MLETVDIKPCKPPRKRVSSHRAEGKREMQGLIQNIRSSIELIPPVNQLIHKSSFVEYVESVHANLTTNDYITERTAVSFTSVRSVTSDASYEADERNIRNWFAMMVRKGLSSHTLRRYLGKLHTLYSDYSRSTYRSEELFDTLRASLDDESFWGVKSDAEIVRKVKELPAKLWTLPRDKADTARALLYLLYIGGAHYSAISELRFGDDIPDIDQLNEIVESMPKERRTYVFPFRHGTVRSKQLYREMTILFTELLTYIGVLHSREFSHHTICGWWIDIAIECGIACEEIVSIIPSIPSTHGWLRLVNPLAMTEGEKLAKLRIVADRIADTAPQWYAMFMRGNNTPDGILNALSNSAPTLLKRLQFFYPTHLEVSKQDGRKVRREVPYLPHILFFKSRPDTVKQLFDTIGHLAWCFRTVNQTDAPYAVISRREMENFQLVIGVLDDSAKIEFVQNPDLVPDRRVRIIGGDFKGYEGVIYRQNGLAQDSDIRCFILKINDMNNIVWQVRIEESFIEPIIEDEN